ncbi:signal peptidase I [Haloplanus natans]|uniref:signal peptidase I n=1 Tax=Haloplanus natans TaxID=376171 RepID=UPI001B7FAC3C|nr:signal peptidase I [Haloplanus natans]
MDLMNDRNVPRLAVNVLVVLVLAAVVVPFVVYAVPGVVGADHGLVVLSGSMEPKMSPGDAVIVREVPASEIQERDIITFQRAGSETPTTHRVIEKRQTENGVEYVTKGDANEERDRGTVPQSRVIGEVIFVIPFIGHVVQFANTQLGFLTLVLTPMALFVLSELWELAKSVREPDASKDEATDDPAVPADAAAESGSVDTGVDADAGTDTDTDGDDSGFTLTRSSLQLIVLLLGLYVPYSGYVAWTTREAWSIGAATATGIAFLFGVVLYLASRGAGGGSTSTTSRSVDGVVRRGELPAQIGERTTIPLESVESLVQMALDRDDWVIYDDDEDTYYMTRDDALYLHRASPETDGGTAFDGGTSEVDSVSADGASSESAPGDRSESDDTKTGGGDV